MKHYAEFAGPLSELLKAGREDDKKGSKKPVDWTPEDIKAFEELKSKLAQQLELFQLDPDRPFVMRCDASDFAIGAVLEQAHPDEDRTAQIKIGKTGSAGCHRASRGPGQLGSTPEPGWEGHHIFGHPGMGLRSKKLAHFP